MNANRAEISWKKFARLLLSGGSFIVLLYAAQTSLFKDIQNVQAQQTKICEPGSYKTECTGQQAGCAADAGEARVFQCNADGSGFDEKQSQCETSCAQPAPPPSCSDDLKYCDESINKIVHKHGGYWDGSQCQYAF